jgi:micrococcal nuclease
VSKVVRFNPKRKKPAAGKTPRRKIGRDFFAVLVVGLGIGLSLAWMGVDTSRARVLLANASTTVKELASDLALRSSEDKLPVSSIGDKTRIKQSDARRYPVCSGGATRDNCVVDGDTFTMDGSTIRIMDIDAPETHPPRCAYEADLGDRATRRLSQLLSARAFQLVRADRDIDKYGRQLRVVIRDGRSIGKTLVSEGLARTWTGKRRPWCDGNDSVAG